MSEAPLLELQGDVGYRNRLLIREAKLSIAPESFTAIIGPNGTGKSTLLKTLLGLCPPLSGHVTCAKDLRLGYVPQGAALDAIFPLRVSEIVAQGFLARGHLLAKASSALIQEALERLQIADLAAKPFRELSGGQKQRVLIARALCRKPDLLMLDEPTAGLDWPTESGLLDQLSALHREGTAILWIAHHLSAVLNRVQAVAAIDHSASRLLVKPIEQLCTADLQAVYQQPIELYTTSEGLRSVRQGGE